MKERVISGLLGACFFLLVLWLGSWWYTTFILFLATVGFLEYCRLFQANYRQPQVLLGLFMVWLLIFSQFKGEFVLSSIKLFHIPNVLLLGFILFLVMVVFSRNQFDIYQMSHLFTGTFYIGLGFSYMVEIIWHANGSLIALFILLTIWANDTGAYFTGKNFGKRKLWPAISPNKTIEGSLGGLLVGLVVSAIFAFLFPHLWGIGKFLFVGLLISVVGQLGDLVESAIKRSTGVKDSGSIMPGHGGVLDRFDSLIFTYLILKMFAII